MIIVSYDFTNNKTRSQFSKFLKQYGHKWQYSVFHISNSRRVLRNVLKEVELEYRKKVKKTDSVLIFQLCATCEQKMVKYGHSSNLDRKIIVFK